MPIKYYQIKHNYIEEIGTGAIRKYHNREIREGRAILVATAYQRLKRSLKYDPELLKYCQERASRHHHVTGPPYFFSWLIPKEKTDFRRLKFALEIDDGLMAEAIKEAIKRGHIIV